MPDPLPFETASVQFLRAELRFLSELARLVAAMTELQPILDWIVQTTTALLRADAGSIKLLGADAGPPLAHTRARSRQPADAQSGSWPREHSITVMGHLLVHPGPLASPDLTADPRFPALRGHAAPIRAALAVPLQVGNRVTGMLAVTEAAPGRVWTDDEIALLAIVAASSAGVIEQAQLRIEAAAKERLELEQRRLERELELARTFQLGLVPSGPLTVGAWTACGRVEAARQVGGDAFDYFALEGGRLAVSIADVAGKGVPAAILMANVQPRIRATCTGRVPLGEAMAAINRGVHASAPPGRFVTLFHAELDPAAGRLTWVNAGHNPPLLRRRDGALQALGDGGLPLGLFADSAYAEGTTAFAPGDALLLTSDGISEARDLFEREFGEERLRTWWSARADLGPEAVVADLLAEVERFRGSALPSDDATVVAVAAR